VVESLYLPWAWRECGPKKDRLWPETQSDPGTIGVRCWEEEQELVNLLTKDSRLWSGFELYSSVAPYEIPLASKTQNKKARLPTFP
jgi:hypothetical protein